jgi:hypothetical protein
MSNYASLLIVKKSVINMGIKIHNNLPSELKRIKFLKFLITIKKLFVMELFLFSTRVFQ